jgi:RNA polymerase sigma factor (sigma-70 family)
MTSRHLLAPARLAGSKLLLTQSDERLVDLLRAGSEPAFEAIVSRYRSQLLRYCSALIGRERAEDAVQQTFVNAYDAMRRDDRPLLLKPWLYRIAHNLAHNALRDGARREAPFEGEALAAEQPEQELERRERLRAVLASVQELPARQRDALLLRELEGRSYEEIADALGVGGGAVRQLLNRARTTLRTAATAVTPVGLLIRLPASGGSGGGEALAARVAELTGAAGAGALATKVAATALVTGAVAGGAAMAPLGDSDGTPPPERPAAAAPAEAPAAAAPAAPDFAAAGPPSAAATGRGSDSSGPGGGDRDGNDRDEGDRGHGGGHGGHGGRGNGGHGGGGGDDDRGHGGRDREGNSGPGSASSGSGSSGDAASGSGGGPSGSGGGPSGSGSGPAGGGGGPSGSGSGPSGSGSGSSGSGSSGDAASSGGSGGSGSGSSGD